VGNTFTVEEKFSGANLVAGRNSLWFSMNILTVGFIGSRNRFIGGKL